MLSLNSLLASAFVLLCVARGGLLKQIPSYINVCKRDPNTISDCVLRSVEALRPTLVGGIPELDVPPLDPFFIPELKVINGEHTPVHAAGKDVKVTGAGDFNVKSLSVDLDTLTVRFRVRFAKLHLEGNYKLDINILALPLNGEGTLNADAVKCDAEFVLHAEIVVKDGVEYLKFTSITTDVTMKDYRLKLDGLFKGDKVLGEAANQAINQNKDEFLKATKPYMEKTISKLILDIGNKIVDGLPYDELLPKA